MGLDRQVGLGIAGLLGLTLTTAAWAAPVAACDNSLSPVREGWVWTYRVTPSDPQKPRTSTSVSRTALDGGFQEKRVDDGGTASTARYRCAGGAQLNLDLPRVGGVTITRAAVRGVGLAADPAWKPGARWSLVWTLEGRQGILSGQGTFTAQRQVVGREQVTVPAGTFTAWKVTASYRLAGKLGPLPLNHDLGDFEEWYAEGVGLVKTSNAYTLTELTALKK